MTDKPINRFLTDEQIAALPDQRGVRAWAFDPYLELRHDAAHGALCVMLRELHGRWLQNFKRKPNPTRQKRFVRCLRAILTNLTRVRTVDATLTVGIPSGKARLEKEKRYRPDFMSMHYHLNALTVLQDQGLAWMVKAGHKQEDYAETARYALTEEACKRLLLPDLKTLHFRTAKRDEVVFLKDTSGRLINYRDTDATRTMRANLRRLNRLLDRTDIATNRPLNSLTDYDDKYSGERTDLYRVFNNNSFEEGGRFYGGWWQHAKKHIRPRITLDGQPTVEADFKGLHPAILFAKNGLPIPDDPYATIPGVAGNDELRVHAKIAFLALLNAGKGGTREPMDFQPSKHDMTKKEFQQSIRNAFPMLPNIFGTGIGLRLQREDSDLAERIMLHFAEQDIPVLPVHDSFIIASRHQDELVHVMQAVFHDAYGQTPTVTVTHSSPSY